MHNKCMGLYGNLAFFPSTVERSLEFMAVKNFGKELGNDDHNNIKMDHAVNLI